MSTLTGVVTAHLPFLEGLTDVQASRTPGPGVWSAKQILGHLIDSGVNNHQRFVRAGTADGLEFAGHDQTAWGAYQTQLARVIAALPAASLEHTLSIGGGEPVTLRFVVEDDVRHQQRHLEQIPGRVGA